MMSIVAATALVVACMCGGASPFPLLPSPPPSSIAISSSPASFEPRRSRHRHHSLVASPLAAETAASSSSSSSAAAAAGTASDEKVDDASTSSSSSSSAKIINLRALDGSERSMRNAAEFMVDAFWRVSGELSDGVRSSLVDVQADDLCTKYGERMGKRKLDALVIAAFEGGGGAMTMRGMITVEVRLLEKGRDLLSAKESESTLTKAVSSLGPKQRREYKDASVIDVANRLLPPEYIAACSLSNLCVSPSHRGRGVANMLCLEAERVAREEFGGFDEMYLRVEKSNEAAVGLYEGKLGYERAFDVNGATALRVDVEAGGSFVEGETDIVLMRKKI